MFNGMLRPFKETPLSLFKINAGYLTLCPILHQVLPVFALERLPKKNFWRNFRIFALIKPYHK